MSYSEHIKDKYYGERLSPSQKEELEQFCEWLDEVEDIVLEETGYNLSSLPDQSYREYFEDSVSAETVAEIVIGDLRLYGDIIVD